LKVEQGPHRLSFFGGAHGEFFKIAIG